MCTVSVLPFISAMLLTHLW